MGPFNNDYKIQPSDQRINLKNAIDLILDFNENEYYENEDEDYETIDQNEIIKGKNDYLIK